MFRRRTRLRMSLTLSVDSVAGLAGLISTFIFIFRSSASTETVHTSNIREMTRQVSSFSSQHCEHLRSAVVKT